MSDLGIDDLKAMAALHKPTVDGYGVEVCAHDSQPWPCHDAVLLAAVDVLRDDIAKLHAYVESGSITVLVICLAFYAVSWLALGREVR